MTEPCFIDPAYVTPSAFAEAREGLLCRFLYCSGIRHIQQRPLRDAAVPALKDDASGGRVAYKRIVVSLIGGAELPHSKPEGRGPLGPRPSVFEWGQRRDLNP